MMTKTVGGRNDLDAHVETYTDKFSIVTRREENERFRFGPSEVYHSK